MYDCIGFRTIGYRNQPPEAAIRSIAAIGYDGVELCLEHPGLEPEEMDASRATNLATVAAGAGIEVASVSYHGDRDPLPIRWRRALLAIELTEAFGSDILIINAPRPRDDEPGLRDEFLRQLERQLVRAEALGVTLALEPEPGLLVHGTDDMLALTERMGSERLRVNLDLGHAFLTEPDLPETIRRLSELIVCAHIEDMPRGEHRHLVPGEGDMDLPEVLVALEGIGFDGWLTVDLFDIADTPDEAAAASLTRMRELTQHPSLGTGD